MWWKKKQADIPRRRQVAIDQSVGNKRSDRALFQRNRTLTGSLSTAVSSANELEGDLRSPRVHAHHLTAHRRRLGTVLMLVAIVIGFLTWLLYEFTVFVHVTPTVSSVVIQQDRYQKIIEDYYAVHPIERLRLFADNTQLNDYVKRMAPEVASIRITGAAGFATGQFDMTPREPVAGWLIGNNQYYVDRSGIAFQTNYFDQPTVKIVDQSGIPQTAGTTVASSRFLGFIGRAVAYAKDYGMTVEQAIIPPNTTRQIELKIAGHTYPVKLSLDRPVGEQIEDMQRAVAYLDGKGMKPEYVDVRVSGKAYYK